MQEEFFVCSCGSHTHLLVLSYDEEWDEIFVSVVAERQSGFFRKIWNCINYLIGQDLYYGDIILTKEKAKQLSDKINEHV